MREKKIFLIAFLVSLSRWLADVLVCQHFSWRIRRYANHLEQSKYITSSDARLKRLCRENSMQVIIR